MRKELVEPAPAGSMWPGLKMLQELRMGAVGWWPCHSHQKEVCQAFIPCRRDGGALWLWPYVHGHLFRGSFLWSVGVALEILWVLQVPLQQCWRAEVHEHAEAGCHVGVCGHDAAGGQAGAHWPLIHAVPKHEMGQQLHPQHEQKGME